MNDLKKMFKKVTTVRPFTSVGIFRNVGNTLALAIQ